MLCTDTQTFKKNFKDQFNFHVVLSRGPTILAWRTQSVYRKLFILTRVVMTLSMLALAKRELETNYGLQI